MQEWRSKVFGIIHNWFFRILHFKKMPQLAVYSAESSASNNVSRVLLNQFIPADVFLVGFEFAF